MKKWRNKGAMSHQKNKKMKWIYLLSVTILLACNSTKKTQEESSTVPQGRPALSITEYFLTFERSLCYGTCPSFKVVVKRNGEAYYEGRKFVDLIGTYEAKLSPEQAKMITDEASKIGYYEMDEVYDDPGVTDVPSMTFQLANNEEMKSVHARFNTPKELVDFGKFLDGILLNLEWKETSMEMPNPPAPPTTKD